MIPYIQIGGKVYELIEIHPPPTIEKQLDVIKVESAEELRRKLDEFNWP